MSTDTLPLLDQIERVIRAQEALEVSLRTVRELNASVSILAREEGARAALIVAPTSWVDQFTRVVEDFARRGEPFTSEDVTVIVGRPQGDGENKNNAVGALMMRLARELHLTRTGRTRVSTTPRSRGRLLCEWVAIPGGEVSRG